VLTRPCAPPDSSRRTSVQRESLPGEYRLTLVATSGALAGRSTSGSLSLGAHSGRAAIDLASVGAVAPGDIASVDSTRPGVLVVESPTAATRTPPLILRFGADANQSDRQPFDGAHMALFVDAVSPNGINGRWTSGVDARSAAGYFCAERATR